MIISPNIILIKKSVFISLKKLSVPKFINYIYYLIFIIKRIDKKSRAIIHIHSVKTLPYIIFLNYFYRNSKIVYDTHELETETMGLKSFRKKTVESY